MEASKLKYMHTGRNNSSCDLTIQYLSKHLGIEKVEEKIYNLIGMTESWLEKIMSGMKN